MAPQHLLSVVLIASALVGLISPLQILGITAAVLWWPTWMPSSREAFNYAGIMITATTGLLVAGVPAALYERLMVLRDDPLPGLKIWAAVSVAFLALNLMWLFSLMWRFS
jgi:hypothetical protein